MAIYLLDEDLSKSAQMLDDASLKRQIKELAQVLCDVHHKIINDDICTESMHNNIDSHRQVPLKDSIGGMLGKENKSRMAWVEWCTSSKWNFNCLHSYSCLSLDEYLYRHHNHAVNNCAWLVGYDKFFDKYLLINHWLRNSNVTMLSDRPLDPYPIVLPKKYRWQGEFFKDDNIYKSYRAYYKAKIEKGILSDPRKEFKWTKRQPPEFLTIYHEVVTCGD